MTPCKPLKKLEKYGRNDVVLSLILRLVQVETILDNAKRAVMVWTFGFSTGLKIANTHSLEQDICFERVCVTEQQLEKEEL